MELGRARRFWIALTCLAAVSKAAAKVYYGYEDPSKNFIKNWDFEDDFGPNDWYASNVKYEFISDSYTGARSVRIYEGTAAKFKGVTQKVYGLKSNTSHYLSMFVKAPNEPTGLFAEIRVMVFCKTTSGEEQRYNVGRIPKLRNSSLWLQLGGDFVTPADVDYLTIQFRLTPADYEFYLDTVSLIELPFDPDWRNQTDIEIDKHRKSMLTLSMFVPKALNAFCKMTVKLTQKKRHFGIGSAMKADVFNQNDEFGEKYREFFFKTFEWAVYENDMKWKPMEKYKGSPNFGRVDTSLEKLEEHNVTVRGHSVLWSVKDANPTWVTKLKGQEVADEVFKRIDYVVSHYKGRLVEWDVVNEYLHADYYSSEMGTSAIDVIHNRTHEIDPNVSLVLNDYQILRESEFTSALVALAKSMKARNVPVHGLGLQTHMLATPVSPERIKKRLEIASGAGLPLTMTEVSIHSTDEKIRAWQLEVMLRMAFSNPAVKAFIFWEFSDLPAIAFKPEETALFKGPDYEPTEAGAVLLDLLKKWRTNKTFVPKARYMRERLLAFHGLYEAQVYYKDQPIKNVTFYLHPGEDLSFRIPLTANEVRPFEDGDQDNCGIWTPDEPTITETDPSTSRKRGRAYERLKKLKKKTKVVVRPYVKGRNVAVN